jgi:hypothetical protein
LSEPSSLQLPAQVLQHLWRGTGYLVPTELDELVSFLQKTREAHKQSFAGLRREYESYVAICKSYNLVPNDPLASTNDWRTLEEFESSLKTRSGAKQLDVPIKFSLIDRLRAAEQTLSELDLITRVLIAIKDRFSNKARNKNGQVHLYVSSRGTGIALQLVYEPRTTPNGGRIERAPLGVRPITARPANLYDTVDWINLGLKAVERKKVEQSQQAYASLDGDSALPPEVDLTWNSTLDSMLRILQNDKPNDETSQEN